MAGLYSAYYSTNDIGSVVIDAGFSRRSCQCGAGKAPESFEALWQIVRDFKAITYTAFGMWAPCMLSNLLAV